MKRIKAVAFDLDGTIYSGKKLIPGALSVVRHLKSKGIEVLYFTNNSVRTRKEIFEKLRGLGLDTEIRRVYCCAHSAGLYLKKNRYKKVFCFGSSGLRAEITKAGVKCASTGPVQAVVTGLDPEFDYKKLSAALAALQAKGCRLIICNRDRNYPSGGRILPGCGAIAASLEAASGRKADFIVGKPGTFMMELLCREWGLTRKDVLIVGDTYDSDVLMAKEFGAKAVFISREKKKYANVISIRKITELERLFK